MLRVLVVAWVGSIVSSPVAGQAVATITPGGAQSTAKVVPERISVTFENVALPDAIWTIAQRAGTTATFDRNVLPAKRISYQALDVAPEVALAAILNGTGFRASRRASGTFVVVKVPSKGVRGQGVITGKITDTKTGRGIPGANVSISTDTHSATTDEDGSYRILGISTGVHTVSVRLVGYAKQTRTITVGEGATVTADFKLEQSANVLDQVIVTGTVVASEVRSVPNAITIVTAKQIEERGITKIDQLFRGDIPGLFAQNQGSNTAVDEVTMFSRGTISLNAFDPRTGAFTAYSNPIKTYVDGVELADSKYLAQIDPKSIERIEILTGPQASTIYGSNAINGVMQIFTKRGSTSRPQLNLSLLSGWVENNFSSARTPQHDYSAQISGLESRFSYNAGGSWNYMGPWTPAKQLARTSGFGGGRLDLSTSAGHMTADLSLRRGITQNARRGRPEQTVTEYRETGWYTGANASGLLPTTIYTLSGQTLSATLTYVPTAWWSQELGLGSDVSDFEFRRVVRGYSSVADTNLSLSRSYTDRRSIRYATTARVPISSFSQLTLTAGADSWQNLISSLSASSQTLTGTFTGSTSMSRRPGHNTGGFFQSQFGIHDRLFFTYGMRMEKNPTIGDKARVLPGRYGVAYTQELGAITAKLRGAYGRSIKPPAPALKEAVAATDPGLIAFTGGYDAILANPNLAPEYQQGGEGGLELYLGTRGSLVITRYNQTVDGLIRDIRVDSVKYVPEYQILFGCQDWECRAYQSQYLNVGGIRNQGWELQAGVNLGHLTTRGTYSWTKSRVTGITPKYRWLFTPTDYPDLQPGATFRYLPEHTWAFGATYAQGRSSVSLNVTGTGRTRIQEDDFSFRNLSSNIRLAQNRLNVSTSFGYIQFNAPYALADLQASHRFSMHIEAMFQVQNLTDRYINDFNATYASLGRQAKLGLRIRGS